MNDVRFMVDNNALMAIGKRRRASRFFREYCAIPEDVLHEARYAPDAVSLASLKVPVTPRVLAQTRDLMATLPVGDTTLVDLFGNKGSADPVLIASTLVAIDEEANTLIPYEWRIVTLDEGVLTKAAELGLLTNSPNQLAAMIDGATKSEGLTTDGGLP